MACLDKAMDHASANNKPFTQRWLICLVAMELIGAALARIGLGGRFDFRSFYSAGYLLRTQPTHLYDLARQKWAQDAFVSPQGFLPFYHLPYEAAMYAPFSLLSYSHAYFAFLALNMLLLLGAFYAARPAFSARIPIWQTEPGSMFFIFVPMLIAAMQCQDSILMLLLCCLAWKQLEKRDDLSAGAILALAMFKFQIALPIAALIAIRRGWRFCAGFLASGAAVLLLCFVIVGRGGMAALLRILLGALSATDKSNALLQNGMGIYPSAMPNIAGLFYACGTRFLQGGVAFGLVCICSLALFLWCARAVRHCDQEVAFSIAILCGLLVSYHAIIHDLTLVLLPIALLAGRTHRYVFFALFALPVALFPFGSNAFFLMALPVLAMLIQATIRSSKMAAREAVMTPAIPV